MANIIESNQWSEAIYEIATTDDVIGGADGISNIQATQLAARSNFLKEHVSVLETHVGNLETGVTSAGQAIKLTTARNISISGDATGRATFDGTTDITIILTQKDSGIKAGNYRQVTVDTKGRVTDGRNPTTLAEYGITDDVALQSWVLGLDYAGGIQRATALANYANLPAGTRLPFAQQAAPTGWKQVNDDNTNNRMLRVVNGGGGNVGGVHSPIINNVVPAHTHSFTTGHISADHTHVIQDPGHAHGVYDPGHSHVNITGDAGSGEYLGSGNTNKLTARAGGGAATTRISIQGAVTGIWNGGVTSNHTHSGSTDNGSSKTNWQPRYIDMIICVKKLSELI
jgi:hypothetical protein